MNRSRRCNTCYDHLELNVYNFKQYANNNFAKKCRACDNKARAEYALEKRRILQEARAGQGWKGVDKTFFTMKLT